MKLTEKEMEIMVVLWGNGIPMTTTEIVEASNNRTWKETSIFSIMNTLIKKGAVVIARHKPTITKNARAYKPALTAEEYMVANIGSARETGMHLDIPTLIECLKKAEER